MSLARSVGFDTKATLFIICVQQTAAAWRNVFYISAGVYLFGTIFYAIFGSGQKQPWATPPQSDKVEEEEAGDKDKDTSA